MKKKKRILVASEKGDDISQILSNKGFFAYSVDDGKKALNMIYNEPPDLIIVDSGLEKNAGEQIITDIKRDNVFAHLPIILLTTDRIYEDRKVWSRLPVDDYLLHPVSEKDLLKRIGLAFFRMATHRDSNPLTGLPGNISIMSETQKRLAAGKIFSLAYADIDNFKPFNDRYGFKRGDEVLSMVSRLITSIILDLQEPDSFVGHIGGDDFVFMVPPSRVDDACSRIIKNFELITRTFYDETDRLKGFIESTDRQGDRMTFSLMSLSIVVISSKTSSIQHYGEFSTIAAELKKLVKSKEGSNYIKDRRNY